MPCGLSPAKTNGQDTQNLLLKQKKKKTAHKIHFYVLFTHEKKKMF